MDLLLPLPPAPHGTNIAQYAALRPWEVHFQLIYVLFPLYRFKAFGHLRTMSHSSGYERRAFERGGRNRGVENRLLEMGRGTGEGRGDRRIEGKEKEKRHGCRNNAPPPMSHFLDPILYTHIPKGDGDGEEGPYTTGGMRGGNRPTKVCFFPSAACC